MAAYSMEVSKGVVDTMAVGMRDQVAEAVADLVANAYDADAERVVVTAPFGGPLAAAGTGAGGGGRGPAIVAEDDGHGMDPAAAADFYMGTGADRRADPRRGTGRPKGGGP